MTFLAINRLTRFEVWADRQIEAARLVEPAGILVAAPPSLAAIAADAP